MNKKKKDEVIARVMMMAVGAVCGIFVILSADQEKLFGSGISGFGMHLIICMLCIFAPFHQMYPPYSSKNLISIYRIANNTIKFSPT